MRADVSAVSVQRDMLWLRPPRPQSGEESGTVSMPKQGALIAGKFRLRKELGYGGMGVVFQATDERSGATFAIKLMLPPKGVSEKSLRVRTERFKREAEIAQDVEHPNLIKIFGFGVEFDFDPQQRHWYLAMELLEGESLEDYIVERSMGLGRGFSVAETCKILLPCMDGVSALHKAGVVHRDLKPSNIFLCSNRGGQSGPVPVVMDFGIAKYVDKDERRAKLSETGDLIGSPVYMAPEQWLSQETGFYTDVYAFGVMLYEFLAGVLPFPTKTAAVAFAVAPKPPTLLSDLRPDLPAGLEEVVARAMAHNPAKRYQSVAELHRALVRYENVASVSSRRRGVNTTTLPADSDDWGQPDLPHELAEPPTFVDPPTPETLNDGLDSELLRPVRKRSRVWSLTVAGVMGTGLLGWGLYSTLNKDTELPVAEIKLDSEMRGTPGNPTGQPVNSSLDSGDVGSNPVSLTDGPAHVMVQNSVGTEEPKEPSRAGQGAIPEPEQQPAVHSVKPPSGRSSRPLKPSPIDRKRSSVMSTPVSFPIDEEGHWKN